jgi:putative DNA primase/helicase
MTKVYKRVQLAKVNNIPDELKELRQWVVWKLEYRGEDRPRKVPVDPKTGQNASTTDKTQWGSLVQALDYFYKHSQMMGLGFVFTSTDPYCGIDIDDCRDSNTGSIGVWAQELIDKLDSYTEVSPSGTGVKMILNAELPGIVRRRNKIEMYNDKRYFTITGDIVQNHCEICERTKQLYEVYELAFGSPTEEIPKHEVKQRDEEIKLKRVQAISDEELIKSASAAKNGEKFSTLYAGTVNGYATESEADAALFMMLAYWTRGDAERMEKLFRASGLMRPKFDRRQSGSSWGRIQINGAIAKTKNFYDPDIENLVRNDTANADLFRGMVDGEYLWIDEWQRWLHWNGVYWERNATGEVRKATRMVQEERAQRSGLMMTVNQEEAKAEFKWAIRSGDAPRRAAIERLTRDMLARPASEFDKQQLLLPCANGVLDLRTGELRPGKREDMLTRNTGFDYNAEARCPRFDKFLLEIMSEDEEMVAYLWRVFGYALTGDTSERAFFMMHGSGRNGKSTLVETLQALVGAYSQAARFETFLQKYQTRNDPRDDLAILAGARLVVAQEADESKTLDAALIKTLTGGDTVVARFLYGVNFEFKPTFKLFLVTNHSPKINESSHALWDRLHYIPFEKRFTDDEMDPRLGAKLHAELPGILARAVAGCIEWQRESLNPPNKVIRAGDELHETMDIPGRWLEENCVVEEYAKVRHGALYADYSEWCKKNGFKYPLTSHTLSKYLEGRRLTDFRTHGAKWWKGVGLKIQGEMQ